MLKKKPFWLALLLVFGLLTAACGDDDDSGAETTDSEATDEGAAPSGDGECPEDVEGDVNISGSSTVEPISAAVGEKLLDCSGIAATVNGPGTGDGFVLFCDGETDISDASRPISEEEAASCAANGIDYIELKVAFDGISVLTNPANEDVECVSFADLYALVGPESNGVDNWSAAQALATDLGSSTEFPDADLEITAPGAESGTFDSFVELVITDIAEARLESGDVTEDQVETVRNDYSSQADDTAIIAAMEAGDTPLGWVGFAFAEEAGDQVKELAVSAEPDGECIAPTADTISDGSYPISRPLFIYVNAAAAEENPAVAGYVDYYLGDEGLASVSEVGYVDLPEDQIEETRAIWDAKTTGTREG